MIILLLVIGLISILLGVYARFSNDKYWWWSTSNPVVPTNIVFGAFPAGLMFFLMAYTFYYQEQGVISPSTRDTLLYFGVFPLMLLTIIFTIWQPNWLKPKWLQWLETHHGSNLGILRKEAQKEDWAAWSQRTSTQEGLKEWVEEARQKYKLDHPDQRFIGNPHDK